MLRKFIKSYGSGLGIVFAMLLTISCAHIPRWTPEMVSPPESLTTVLEKINTAKEEGKIELESDDTNTIDVTRDGTILLALARNRSLAVEQYEPGISATYISDARAAFDPNILATGSYERNYSGTGSSSDDGSVLRSYQGNMSISEFFPTGTEVFLSGSLSRTRYSSSDRQYSGSWSMGINQSLLKGAGTEVNLVSLRQAENNAAITQHELRGYIIDLVAQVEDAYWELVLANETLKIRQFAVQLSSEQLDLNRDLISVGKLSEDNEISAQADLASSNANLVDAEADIKARTIELIRLLNPDKEFQWATNFNMLNTADVEEVNLKPAVSAKLADLYRPELAQAKLSLANHDLEVIKTKNGLLPNLTAFASFGRISSGDSSSGLTNRWDDNDHNNYEVGLSLEIDPINRSQKSTHQRALFQQQQAEVSILNLEQLIEAEVRSAVIEVQRQWEKIMATKELVKSREEELKVEQAQFVVGRSTNLDVLQVQENLIQAQLDEVTSRIHYIQSLTSLYQVEGTLLDRRGVGIDKEWEM